jgi:3-phenylpropionate/trans-cinnamate dioxygenase ferredoxin subunit
MTWTDVLDEKALAEGMLQVVYPQGVNVVLARVDGAVHAVAGACVHLGCPLFNGTLVGHTLTCPCHDWRFDLRTGRFLDAPELGLQVYGARAEQGRLFVSLDSTGGAP